MNRLSGAIDSHRIDVRLRAIGQAVCLLLISALLMGPGRITSSAPVATLVKNINVVPRSGLVNTLSPMVTIGNTAYLIANDGMSGWELWKSDGAGAGTVLVKDICPGV